MATRLSAKRLPLLGSDKFDLFEATEHSNSEDNLHIAKDITLSPQLQWSSPIQQPQGFCP
jgi:hypothetical protein